ncbi:hypothetical protein BDV96DRAFT_649089 [Lophiotrema nucula]|uniref:Uncharacterized protein n=1 Tax=Lophiotrema nucula TaxID=690887 RepID=A0A6A5Z0B2_9PLEO|nr:hypothetical protein BDV96DRAFT_649089 [Lophiotrema nucula]
MKTAHKTYRKTRPSKGIRAARSILISGFLEPPGFPPLIDRIRGGIVYRISRRNNDIIVTFVQSSAAEDFVEKHKNGFKDWMDFIAKVEYKEGAKAPLIPEHIYNEIINNGANRVLRFRHDDCDSYPLEFQDILKLDKWKEGGRLKGITSWMRMPSEDERGVFIVNFTALEDAYEIKKKFDEAEDGLFDIDNELFTFNGWKAEWANDPCGEFKEEPEAEPVISSKTAESSAFSAWNDCARGRAEEQDMDKIWRDMQDLYMGPPQEQFNLQDFLNQAI